MYYHVAAGVIVAGPFDIRATYIKKLTSCGNPEALPNLAEYGILPRVLAPLQPWQTHGDAVVYSDRVEVPIGADRDVELECLNAIDYAADAKRVALVSPGSLVDQEYLMAYDDAQEYKAAGYTGTVPGGVSTWATSCGWTAQQAADDIIYQRAVWKQCSDSIRAIRLTGKQAVRDATTAEGKWLAREAAIAQFGTLGW